VDREIIIVIVVGERRVPGVGQWTDDGGEKGLAEVADVSEAFFGAFGHGPFNHRAQFGGDRGVGVAWIGYRRVEVQFDDLDIIGIVIGQFAG
jgi:hypothetical protein